MIEPKRKTYTVHTNTTVADLCRLCAADLGYPSASLTFCDEVMTGSSTLYSIGMCDGALFSVSEGDEWDEPPAYHWAHIYLGYSYAVAVCAMGVYRLHYQPVLIATGAALIVRYASTLKRSYISSATCFVGTMHGVTIPSRQHLANEANRLRRN